MKKLLTLFVLFSVCTITAFSQNNLLDVNNYVGHFGFKNGEIDISSQYVMSAPRTERRTFASLGGVPELVDTPLEFALLSYYSQPVLKIRPAQANAIIPANNPKLSDTKLGAAVF